MPKQTLNVIIILLILCSTIFISGCTSYNTFHGTQMSFQYPSDLKSTDSGNIVELNEEKNGIQVPKITVELLSTTVNDEIVAIVSEGYTFNGDYEASGVRYKSYQQGDQIVYLFQKNGKTFQVIGDSSLEGPMQKIVETIK